METIKSHCNSCLGSTRHVILHECERYWPDDNPDEDGPPWIEHTVYQLVSCLGCDTVSLRRTFKISGSTTEIDVFPAAVSRQIPQWITSNFNWHLEDFKRQLLSLLREVYSALHSDNLRLALMGTRCLIDMALTDKLGDQGGFERKLKAAVSKGWLTQTHHDTLAKAIDAGNAAAHRGYKPEPQQFYLILDIVEHLLQFLYSLEESADSIASKTPQRANPPKS